MSKISWNRLLGYLYFSNGKLKSLLNFNTRPEKYLTQKQALHEIICSTLCNKHLPRPILILFCTAEACCPRDPHLGLTFFSGAISFPYLGEKWHLLKILKHATLGWDLDSSLENNSRLCGSLNTAGQHTSCCWWQGAIRWQIPQTGSSTVTLNKEPGQGSAQNETQRDSLPFPLVSQVSSTWPEASGFQWESVFVPSKIPTGKVQVGDALEREPSYPGPISLLQRVLLSHSDQLFWKFVSYLFCLSFPVCKNMTGFKPQNNKPF